MNKKSTSHFKGIKKIANNIAVALIMAFVFIFAYNNTSFITNFFWEDESASASLVSEQPLIKAFQFGYPADEYHFTKNVIRPNQFLGDILNENGISFQRIAALEEKAKDIFSVRKIREGKNYTLVKKDSCDASVLSFIYEPNALTYVKYELGDKVDVEVINRDFETCIETASGQIESSLWNAMVGKGMSPILIDLMEDALASSVDFYRTQEGDQFKLIYEKKYIDGKPVSLGKLLGAYYKNDFGESYSFFFENARYSGYFDEEGRPTKKAFLRSPVKYSRISSRYNLRRFHPIKKRTIPHLGTDYAAPYGTPIRAVADGVVSVASYTKNNGRYVKIKHDRVHATQYLHMQNIAKGVRPGVKVRQGQTIGYVGSTGLATGPHVCFRFWKHGKQVDPLRENFPPPDPMPEEELPEFYKTRDLLSQFLDEIEVTESTLIAESKRSQKPNP